MEPSWTDLTLFANTSPAAGGRLALFDLDGTLTDPAEGIVESFRRGFKAVGIDAAAHEPLERFIGPPLHDTFASVGLAPSRVNEAVAAYRSYFAVHGIFQNRLYDGVVEVLHQLRRSGWTLAVATSKPEPFAVRILDHFDLAVHFDVVAGATMDGSRRHKADVIAHALAQAAAVGEFGHRVMIGDRAVDINGAKTHAVASIGVVWGYGQPAELIAADPSALAAEPSDLLQLLST